MKKTVVLYPGLAVSHFVPMMQLADVLLDAGYAVVVALIDPADKEDIAFAAVVSRVTASKPHVAFHKLPRVEDPPTVIHDAQFLLRYLDLVGRYDELLHGFLRGMPPGSVHAVVVDALSVGALAVAKKLGIPAYSFFVLNASTLAVFLQLPTVRREGQPCFRDLGDARLDFHGVPPMPASHLVEQVLQDPESEVYKVIMDGFRRMPEAADGILVNTFASLETRAVEALAGDLLRRRLPSPPPPPVYCVGPLLAESGEEKEKHECLSWLDEQPERSVVYLCFGSVGTGNHSREQLTEIAVGLENSGHRFLWVVRAPLGDGDDPRADPDLDALLPDGFLERTSGRGRVLKLWAPQVDVLHHKATGAFVTHCGWNSVLEGVAAGVPMLCWPLYAEQKMNKVFMVEEAGIGVEVVGWQQGHVMAAEVEAKVRMVLGSEEGDRLRAQVTELSKAAAAAWQDGGTSRVAFQRFLSDAEKLKAQAVTMRA